VNDTIVMGVVKCTAYLRAQFYRFSVGKLVVGQPVVQRGSCDEFANDINRIAVATDTYYGRVGSIVTAVYCHTTNQCMGSQIDRTSR
jgi:hypothetical protein